MTLSAHEFHALGKAVRLEPDWKATTPSAVLVCTTVRPDEQLGSRTASQCSAPL